MALVATPPPVILLTKIKEIYEAADWIDLTLIPIGKIRHVRNRSAMKNERPCVSIGFAGDAAEPDAASNGLSNFELVRAMSVDIAVDLALPTEDSGLDPTGYLSLLRVAAAAFQLLYADDSPLRLFAWDVRRNDLAPDEDSSPDDGRLVMGVDVIYRVSSTEPNRLLAEGIYE